jgi:hypothetical protein
VVGVAITPTPGADLRSRSAGRRFISGIAGCVHRRASELGRGKGDPTERESGANLTPARFRVGAARGRTAYRLTSDCAGAQDLVQETLLRAYTRLHLLQGECAGQIGGWPYIIHLNLFCDWLVREGSGVLSRVLVPLRPVNKTIHFGGLQRTVQPNDLMPHALQVLRAERRGERRSARAFRMVCSFPAGRFCRTVPRGMPPQPSPWSAPLR